MMEQKSLLKMLLFFLNKKKELLLYFLFGILTTVLNVVAYSFFYTFLNIENIPASFISWLFSVCFAFVTNKIFVFECNEWNKNSIKECISFLLCRTVSGVIDIMLMYCLVDKAKFNGVYAKLIVNILVIVLNFLASKLIIFKSNNN